jgi:hypothetical protein
MSLPRTYRDLFQNFGPPAIFLAWRAAVLPASQLAGDWVAIVAAFFLLRAFAPHRQVWTFVTVATVTLLLGIYLFGQIPYTLIILGRSP